MKYRFLILIVLLFSSLFILEKSPALSQQLDINSLINSETGLPTGIQEQISIEQIPRVPNPNQPVSFRIESFLTNLNNAQITWIQNGEVLNSGTGLVTQAIQAPDSGETSIIQIRITKEEGGVLTQTITLNPSQVDLIYEAQTYTPPFYKGKSLYTSESVVEVIAVPHFLNESGQRMDSSTLVYTWRINGTVQQDFSGYGKDFLSFQGSLIERPVTVSVEVSAPNSTLLASNTLRFSSSDPDFVLYENNPVFGVIYEQAIQGSFLLNRPQIDFEGVPYFFSTYFKNSGLLSYAWTINGTRITNKSSSENYLVLRNDENEEGTARIGVTVSHINNLLQQKSNRFELLFEKIENTINNNEEFTF